MKKKYISAALITMISISSLAASVDENIDSLVNYALNNNVNYLSAILDLEQSEDDLVVDPVFYDSSISLQSDVKKTTSDFTTVSTMSVEVPVLEQLSLNAKFDTDLDGSLGFTFTPLTNSTSNVANELTYENNSVYLSEYKDELNLDIAQSYLNYLIANEKLEQQNDEVELYKKKYEEKKELYTYDKVTLIEVQEALIEYTDAQNDIRDFEVELYTAKINLYELLNTTSDSALEIPTADLSEVVELSTKIDSILDGKQFSPLSDFNVVKALNSTISLQDSYDNLDWYEPTFNISGNVDLDGTLSASVLFKTSFNDYNGDEKIDLENEIDLAKLTAASTISQVNNDIDLLQKSIEIDRQGIEAIQLQIEQNDLVMDEAAALLLLDEYEVLDYETLELNANNLKLNLIEAYVNLYVDQLKLVNYL